MSREAKLGKGEGLRVCEKREKDARRKKQFWKHGCIL